MKEFTDFSHVAKLLSLGLKKDFCTCPGRTHAWPSETPHDKDCHYFLGLKEPEEPTEHVRQITQQPRDVIRKFLKSGLEPQPQFTPVDGNINPLRPWEGIDCTGQFQTYVTRKDEDIPVLVEIKSWRAPDGIDRRWAGEPMDDGEVEFGNCFTLNGEYLDLSPEELERIEREFRA